MHLVITGGAGYVGSTVTAHLLAAGARVTVFDRLFYGGEALLPFLSHPHFRLIVGDVRDASALAQAAMGTDAVIHLAAIVGEPACSVDDAAAWSINVDGTQGALDAAVAARVNRFLFISTCSNYGVANANVIADEDTPLHPMSRYAEAKVAAERLTLGCHAPMGTTVLRLGTICGVSPRMRFDLLVSDMARAAVRGEPIPLYTPNAWRPFLHVQDAARVVERWTEAPLDVVGGQVFNVVGENYQKRGLADLVRKYYPATRIDITDRTPDSRDYRVSGARIERALGFRPARTVEEAFLETAQAVAAGIFRDASWSGHSAVPPDPAALRSPVAVRQF